MKKCKMLALTLSLATAISLAGCNQSETTKETTTESTTVETTVETTTESTTAETTVETTSEESSKEESTSSETTEATSETTTEATSESSKEESTGTEPEISEPSTSGDKGSKKGGEVKFTTTDRAGNVIDESVFSGHKVTLLNFFETWCGPCVAEIPELEKLYEEYDRADFQIIGVYGQYPGEEDTEAEMDQIIKDSNLTYLLLHFTPDLEFLTTQYVPTTIMIDENGNVIEVAGQDRQIIGSNSYAGWKQIIDQAIKQVSE